MGRINWGGAADLSGVFAALQGRYEADVEADVANAKARAVEAQAAEDREMHAKWMAGKISDEQWLAHLERRIDESLDPEERSQYTEMLLEHRGAIEDAQMEAQFALGKVSLGALMKHYSRRMASVQKESPAWRELATRYGQLSQSGYGGYGGGGGGGRGGGRGGRGGGADPATVVGAGIDVLQSGEMFKGIHTGGPDLVDPTLSMRPIEDDDDLINALLNDIERIEQLEDWMEAHPNDRTVVDEATGEEFEVSGDFLTQLDKQYLRTQQALAAAYYARGTSEDDKKGTQALGYATSWVAGAMTRHNTMKVEPQVQALEQFVFAELVGASNITDPEERRRQYARTLSHVATFANKNGLIDRGETPRTFIEENPGKRNRRDMRETSLPDALRPDDDVYTRIEVLRGVLEIGAHSDRYSMDEINAMADAVLALGSSIGEGGSSISVQTLLTGPGDDSSDVPDTYIGLLETMTQIQGLEAGRRILAGVPDPEYDGPVYVYAYDGERTRAVVADVRDQANGAGGVSPVLVPQGEDPSALVMARVKVGNRAETVWVRPQPVDDPRFRVYRRGDDLLTSAEIKELGSAQLQALVGRGEIEVDSVLTGVQMPDGRVWFRDNETGMFHLRPPVLADRDPVTGGVQVDDEGEPVVNFAPFARGVMTPFAGIGAEDMQRWTEQAIAMGLVNPASFQQRGAGGELLDLDSIDGMYFTPQQQRRTAPLLMEDQIRARESISEREFNEAGRDTVTAIRQQEAQRSELERTRQTAERMGIQIGGRNVGPDRERPQDLRGRMAYAAPPREQATTPADRYGEAIRGAMAAMRAREERTKTMRRVELKPLPKLAAPIAQQAPLPPAPKPPLPLLAADGGKKPVPQYQPKESKPASTPGSAGGAKLL